MREIKVAILGKWAFHATEFVLENRKVPGCNMVAAWDPDPIEGRRWAEELNMVFYEDYHTILADPEIDAVLVATATVDHAEICVQAARAGKAIMVEKAPSLTAESALAVREAVEEAGVLFSFSDPLVKPEILQLKKMIDEGFFGKITMVNVRYAHAKAMDGELPDHLYHLNEAGAGVSVDIGCHGTHMLLWFLGLPQKCVSVFGSFTEQAKKNGIDDNSSVTFLYENGVIATVQSSWAARGEQGTIDVYGTNGCAHAFGGKLHYCLADKQWHTITRDEMPKQESKPMDQWLDALINGNQYPRYHEAEAEQLAKMLGAAIATANNGYEVK